MKALFLLLGVFLVWGPQAAPAVSSAKKKVLPREAPAQAKEIWSVSFAGAEPVAVFFDAGAGDLVVSLHEPDGSRLDRVSLDGKLEKKAVARGKGEAGPLRASGGYLYWIAGDSVLRVDGETLTLGRVPKELGDATDIAVSGKGVVYLGMSSGALYRLQNQEGTVLQRGGPIQGIFLLQDTLYLLRGASLQPVGLGLDTDQPQGARISGFCGVGTCRGLERSSGGFWLTTQGSEVWEIDASHRRRLLGLGKQRPGRLAYVYRKEPKEDFFVLPFPDEHLIRAYRMPGWK